MKKLIKYFILIYFGLSACRYKDPYATYVTDTLSVVNNSDVNILFLQLWTHPDTSLPLTPTVFSREKDKLDLMIVSHTSKSFQFDFSDQIEIRDTSRFPMYFYFFNEDTVRAKTWAEISTNYLVLKRYAYTFNQLDSLNWTITYP